MVPRRSTVKQFFYFVVALMVGTMAWADELGTTSQYIIDQTVSAIDTAAGNMMVAPFLSAQDIRCLARNIFYEAASEPMEGKVAVGMVTLNRAQDPRYPSTVCQVVTQRTVSSRPQRIVNRQAVTKEEPRQDVWGRLTGATQETTQIVSHEITRWQQVITCQFSWNCQHVAAPKKDDPRWIESQHIAENLAHGAYPELQAKYSEAMNFHSVRVHPNWRLRRINRVGNHIFYQGEPVQQGG